MYLCLIRVMFRGILVCMSTLYQRLLEFLREVALAQPMPFLTDFSLPADLVQFLCPSDALLLSKHPMHGSHAKGQKRKGQKIKKPFVKVKTQRQVKEDLGVTVERGAELQALFRCSVKLSFSLVATFLYQCE